MTSTSDKEKEDLKKRLFLPNHCPNQYDWAKYHAEGALISFDNKRGEPLSLSYGPERIEYLREFSVPFGGDCHFAKITALKENPKDGFVGYFNPIKRRATFCYGQKEPNGLLMFFLWHSMYDQNLERLPAFFDLFLQSKMGRTTDILDFDNFLEIMELIGQRPLTSRLVGTGICMVRSFEKIIRKANAVTCLNCDKIIACSICNHFEDISMIYPAIYGCLHKLHKLADQWAQHSEIFKELLNLHITIQDTIKAS